MISKKTTQRSFKKQATNSANKATTSWTSTPSMSWESMITSETNQNKTKQIKTNKQSERARINVSRKEPDRPAACHQNWLAKRAPEHEARGGCGFE
jgi:hypothetical protein